jgi:uncharacterized membrane protein HdeD (DUF308 family)
MFPRTEQGRQINIWWMFAIQGSAGSLVGIALLTAFGTTNIELINVIGFYWFITGLIAFARLFIDHANPWIWSIFTVMVAIPTGFLMMEYPTLVVLTVPAKAVIIFGALGLAMGLVEIIDGFITSRIGSIIVGVATTAVALPLLTSSIASTPVLRIAFGVVLIVQNVVLGICAFRIGLPSQVSSDI